MVEASAIMCVPRFKKIIPVPEQSMVQMLCYLLECLLTQENTPEDCSKELYELYFVFAAVWAFGGAMFQDQVLHRPLENGIQSVFGLCIMCSPLYYSIYDGSYVMMCLYLKKFFFQLKKWQVF